MENMPTTNLLEAKEKGVPKAIKDVDRLPQAIAHLMKAQNKSERALAESYGITLGTVQNWRKGKCPKTLFVLLEILYTDENLSQ
jgi:DNA-binding transcriptional regulator YiaG